MKHFIDENHTEEKVSYPVLQGWIQEAWDALPASFYQHELALMPAKLQAVIDAEGGITKY